MSNMIRGFRENCGCEPQIEKCNCCDRYVDRCICLKDDPSTYRYPVIRPPPYNPYYTGDTSDTGTGYQRKMY